MNWKRKPVDVRSLERSDGEVRLGALPRASLADDETGWYQRWYFLGRLGDALTKSRKERREVSLLFGRLPLSGFGGDDRWRVYVTLRLGLLAREAGQTEAFFGRISEDEFAVCIPGTDDPAVAARADDLWRRMDALSEETGVAAFPAAAGDVAGLLEAARQALQRRPENVVRLDDYRTGRHHPSHPRAA